MASETEDYEYYSYSSDEEGYPVEEDEADESMEWESVNPNAPPSLATTQAPVAVGQKRNIRLSNAEELRPEMRRRVKDVSEVLDVSTAAANVLLREHNWSKEVLLETYMNNPEHILKKFGVFHRCGHQLEPSEQSFCQICYDEADAMLAMPCGHAFCYECWYDFCLNAISDGPSCVRTTCPQAECTEIVTEGEFKAALGETSPVYKKFLSFQLRSFVESNPLTRWCPGAGCERVACAASASAMESENSIATCDVCVISFCMICGEEPHAPVTCKDLASWNQKCRNESETANWILANTKTCPKCVSRIEKNQGCNHMTCQRCKHEFCWICMGDWAEHGAATGGYYKCNKYDGTGEEDLSDAAKAKRDLDRYLHYYKRFHAHAEAQSFAKKQLKETEARMVLLQESDADSRWSDVEFLKAANEQLVECRRVLKYTYVFAYYLDPRSSSQRDRFEYHQEMLERFTENLSELSEKPLAEMDRTDVVNQTRVVANFLKKIIEYVEDGMDEL